jgi:hypothetical protein
MKSLIVFCCILATSALVLRAALREEPSSPRLSIRVRLELEGDSLDDCCDSL